MIKSEEGAAAGTGDLLPGAVLHGPAGLEEDKVFGLAAAGRAGRLEVGVPGLRRRVRVLHEGCGSHLPGTPAVGAEEGEGGLGYGFAHFITHFCDLHVQPGFRRRVQVD